VHSRPFAAQPFAQAQNSSRIFGHVALHGYANDPIRGLTMVHCQLDDAAQDNYLEAVKL